MHSPAQLKHDAVPASNSDFSEDDIPLNVRSGNGNEREKDAPNDGRPKKTGFVIPRKKKRSEGLLLLQSFNSREGKELMRNVQQSYREPGLGSCFTFQKLEFVQNDKLSGEFQEKKLAMRNEQRNSKELEEKFAFLYTTDRLEARRICQLGLVIGSSSLCCLGDPQMGVYLCRHADVITRKPLAPSSTGILIVFKILKGKVKTVTERSMNVELQEPTPNFDCHVSKTVQNISGRVAHSQLYESSQYYFYEFAEEGEELHVKRPRQCCPHALVTFSIKSNAGILRRQTLATDSILQDEVAGVIESAENEEQVAPPRRSNVGSLGDQHVVWSGIMMNKAKILSTVSFLCYTNRSVNLPFEIGEKIDVRDKITNEKLRLTLPLPVFRNVLHSTVRTYRVFISGDCYMSCVVSAVDDKEDRISKLTSYFRNQQIAGVVRFDDFNKVMYLMPTSQVTHDLGITNDRSPMNLHGLFVKKKPTHAESKGRNVCAVKPSARERKTHNDEARTLERIQEQLTRRFTIKDDFRENEMPQTGDRQVPANQTKTTAENRSEKTSTEQVRPLGNEPLATNPPPNYSVEISSEQKQHWQKSVVNWLSRPSPLTAAESIEESGEPAPKVVKTVHGDDPRLRRAGEENLGNTSSPTAVTPVRKQEAATGGSPEERPTQAGLKAAKGGPGVNTTSELGQLGDTSQVISVESLRKTIQTLHALELRETLKALQETSGRLHSGGSDAQKVVGSASGKAAVSSASDGAAPRSETADSRTAGASLGSQSPLAPALLQAKSKDSQSEVRSRPQSPSTAPTKENPVKDQGFSKKESAKKGGSSNKDGSLWKEVTRTDFSSKIDSLSKVVSSSKKEVSSWKSGSSTSKSDDRTKCGKKAFSKETAPTGKADSTRNEQRLDSKNGGTASSTGGQKSSSSPQHKGPTGKEVATGGNKEKDLGKKAIREPVTKPVNRVIDKRDVAGVSSISRERQAMESTSNSITVVTSVGKYSNRPVLSTRSGLDVFTSGFTPTGDTLPTGQTVHQQSQAAVALNVGQSLQQHHTVARPPLPSASQSAQPSPGGTGFHAVPSVAAQSISQNVTLPTPTTASRPGFQISAPPISPLMPTNVNQGPRHSPTVPLPHATPGQVRCPVQVPNPFGLPPAEPRPASVPPGGAVTPPVQVRPGYAGAIANPAFAQRSPLPYAFNSQTYYAPLTFPVSPPLAFPFPTQPPAGLSQRRFSDPLGITGCHNPGGGTITSQSPVPMLRPAAGFPIPGFLPPRSNQAFPYSVSSPQGAWQRFEAPAQAAAPPSFFFPRPTPGDLACTGPVRHPEPYRAAGNPLGQSALPRRHSADSSEVLKRDASLPAGTQEQATQQRDAETETSKESRAAASEPEAEVRDTTTLQERTESTTHAGKLGEKSESDSFDDSHEAAKGKSETNRTSDSAVTTDMSKKGGRQGGRENSRWTPPTQQQQQQQQPASSGGTTGQCAQVKGSHTTLQTGDKAASETGVGMRDRTTQGPRDTIGQGLRDSSGQEHRGTADKELCNTPRQKQRDTSGQKSRETSSQEHRGTADKELHGTPRQKQHDTSGQMSRDTSGQEHRGTADKELYGTPRQKQRDTSGQEHRGTADKELHGTPRQKQRDTSGQMSRDTSGQEHRGTADKELHGTPRKKQHDTSGQMSRDTSGQEHRGTADKELHGTPRKKQHDTSGQMSRDTSGQEHRGTADKELYGTPRQKQHDTSGQMSRDTSGQEHRGTADKELYGTPRQKQHDTSGQMSRDTSGQEHRGTADKELYGTPRQKQRDTSGWKSRDTSLKKERDPTGRDSFTPSEVDRGVGAAVGRISPVSVEEVDAAALSSPPRARMQGSSGTAEKTTDGTADRPSKGKLTSGLAVVMDVFAHVSKDVDDWEEISDASDGPRDPVEKGPELVAEDVSDDESAAVKEPSESTARKQEKGRRAGEKLPTEQRPLTSLHDELESVSTSSLPLDPPESPRSPATPETARPATDFTHPSLGFWAAPLGPRAGKVPAAAEPPATRDRFGHATLPGDVRASVAPSSFVQLKDTSLGARERSTGERATAVLSPISSAGEGDGERLPGAEPDFREYCHGIAERIKRRQRNLDTVADPTNDTAPRQPTGPAVSARQSRWDPADDGNLAVRKSPPGDEGGAERGAEEWNETKGQTRQENGAGKKQRSRNGNESESRTGCEKPARSEKPREKNGFEKPREKTGSEKSQEKAGSEKPKWVGSEKVRQKSGSENKLKEKAGWKKGGQRTGSEKSREKAGSEKPRERSVSEKNREKAGSEKFRERAGSETRKRETEHQRGSPCPDRPGGTGTSTGCKTDSPAGTGGWERNLRNSRSSSEAEQARRRSLGEGLGRKRRLPSSSDSDSDPIRDWKVRVFVKRRLAKGARKLKKKAVPSSKDFPASGVNRPGGNSREPRRKERSVSQDSMGVSCTSGDRFSVDDHSSEAQSVARSAGKTASVASATTTVASLDGNASVTESSVGGISSETDGKSLEAAGKGTESCTRLELCSDSVADVTDTEVKVAEAAAAECCQATAECCQATVSGAADQEVPNKAGLDGGPENRATAVISCASADRELGKHELNSEGPAATLGQCDNTPTGSEEHTGTLGGVPKTDRGSSDNLSNSADTEFECRSMDLETDVETSAIETAVGTDVPENVKGDAVEVRGVEDWARPTVQAPLAPLPPNATFGHSWGAGYNTLASAYTAGQYTSDPYRTHHSAAFPYSLPTYPQTARASGPVCHPYDYSQHASRPPVAHGDVVTPPPLPPPPLPPLPPPDEPCPERRDLLYEFPVSSPEDNDPREESFEDIKPPGTEDCLPDVSQMGGLPEMKVGSVQVSALESNAGQTTLGGERSMEETLRQFYSEIEEISKEIEAAKGGTENSEDSRAAAAAVENHSSEATPSDDQALIGMENKGAEQEALEEVSDTCAGDASVPTETEAHRDVSLEGSAEVGQNSTTCDKTSTVCGEEDDGALAEMSGRDQDTNEGLASTNDEQVKSEAKLEGKGGTVQVGEHPTLQASREAPSVGQTNRTARPGSARRRAFMSLESLTSLGGVSAVFDQIVREALATTALSLEKVVRRYTGVVGGVCGTGEAVQAHSRSSATRERGEHPRKFQVGDRGSSGAAGLTPQGSPRKRVQFSVYNPDNDKECDLVKTFMVRTGAVAVDLQDAGFLEKASVELRVYIRRRHIPSLHRLCNLYKLKMAPMIKFALFNTLSDLTQNNRFYENVFGSGGAVIPDDHVLRTCDPVDLEALLTFMKEQSTKYQKFVWIMNIARRTYKKLAAERPLTARTSRVLTLLRRYKDAGFVAVLPKDYVAENITPPIQKQLQTALKQQIELMSVYRHFVLLSDLDNNRPEVSWFFSRGIGVLGITSFLKTFAGDADAKRLLYTASVSQQRAETKTECQSPATPEDDPGQSCRTPQSDVSNSPTTVDENHNSTTKSSPRDSPFKASGKTSFTRGERPAQPGSKRPASPPHQVTTPPKLRRSHSAESDVALANQRLRVLSSVRSTRASLIHSVGSAPEATSRIRQYSFSAPSSPSASGECELPVLESVKTHADSSAQGEPPNSRFSGHLESGHSQGSDASLARNSTNGGVQEGNVQDTCLKEADTSCQPTSVPRRLPTGFRAH